MSNEYQQQGRQGRVSILLVTICVFFVLSLIRERYVDGGLLRSEEKWLKASIEEEDEMIPQQQQQEQQESSITFIDNDNEEVDLGTNATTGSAATTTSISTNTPDNNDSSDRMKVTDPTSTTKTVNNLQNNDALKVSTVDVSQTKVVWLMSFPNSGTTYTVNHTEVISGYTAGTNYANEVKRLGYRIVPIAQNGPYLRNPTISVPKYLLTKTHCTGYGDEPQLNILSVDEFEKGCRSTVHYFGKDDTIIHAQYSIHVPVKAIQLYRNPFDNIVARWHYGLKKRKKYLLSDDMISEQEFETIRTFVGWCENMDVQFRDKDKSKIEHLSELEQLPCQEEWFRYVQWHNLATEVAKKNDIPIWHFYYENYELDYDNTVNQLLLYLELPARYEPPEFIKGKTYLDEYTPEQQRAAKRYVQLAATEETWAHLERYFDEIP